MALTQTKSRAATRPPPRGRGAAALPLSLPLSSSPISDTLASLPSHQPPTWTDGRTGVPPAAGGSVPGRTFSGAWGCCTAKQVCHRLREKCKFFFRTVASCKRNKQTSIILNKYKRSVGAEEDPVCVRGQNFDTACGCVCDLMLPFGNLFEVWEVPVRLTPARPSFFFGLCCGLRRLTTKFPGRQIITGDRPSLPARSPRRLLHHRKACRSPARARPDHLRPPPSE